MEELKVNIDGKDHIVRIEEESDKLKVPLEGKTPSTYQSMTKLDFSWPQTKLCSKEKG